MAVALDRGARVVNPKVIQLDGKPDCGGAGFAMTGRTIAAEGCRAPTSAPLAAQIDLRNFVDLDDRFTRAATHSGDLGGIRTRRQRNQQRRIA